MARYYFNILDGRTFLDQDGSELPSLDAARREAVMIARDSIFAADGTCRSIWMGDTSHLWVTDGPSGTGNTMFTVHISASEKTRPSLIESSRLSQLE